MRLSPIAFQHPARQAVRTARGAAVVLALAIGLSACVTDRDVTGSIGRASALPTSDADLQNYSAEWGRRYDADPTNKTAGLNYGRALRAQNRTAQAVAVLETTAIKNPYDTDVLAAYGKTLADVGRLKEAADVLSRAHTPDRPDPSVLSAQGSVADQMGDHQAAQSYYQSALKIEPDNPNILSNLGLSYALDKRLAQAEDTLRSASAQRGATPRVRQNLALVLALEGKFPEAETVARTDLSAADAAASVAAIRTMIATSTTWKAVRQPARRLGTATQEHAG